VTAVLIAVAAVAALALAATLLVGFSRQLLNRDRRVAEVDIVDANDSTTTDRSGAVRSVQAADLFLPMEALEEIWTPMHLERLARTYWRFLTRATLGLIRVVYTERERFVVLIVRPLKLLTFQAPEYEMNAERGIVRWRIERGLLVARQGRGGNGYLQIDVLRCPSDRPGRGRLHVEVEVANFYPAIAAGISRWVYNETQSRIHVIVTHGFLRSLARLDLAESRVGRYAQSIDELPDPPPRGERSPRRADVATPR
jgi:hypothetical protein